MAIELKGGHTTQDRRLDRIPLHDEKNHNFPIRTIVARRAPRTYTWRFADYDPHLDQGQEGACAGFGWANELACRPVSVLGVTNKLARERLYWEAQKIDPWDGGSYPGATPVYEGTSVLSVAKVVQSLGAITEYRWCENLQDLILAVGYEGPVVLGVNWYDGMYQPDAKNYVHVTGSQIGGHCLIARGVNVTRKYFRLRNSWGANWGFNGDCFISFDDMQKLLNDQGEACVPVGRKAVSL